MIITCGRKPPILTNMRLPPPPIVVDADALIALVDCDDLHAVDAFALLKRLRELEALLLYPATTILEAATTLLRKLNKPALVAQIVAATKARHSTIEPVDHELIDEAATLFTPHGSKQNTLFDAIVAAVARRYDARAVFSFDARYTKQGLSLASDLLSP
jgi:predicted nucleic acid-binding protein